MNNPLVSIVTPCYNHAGFVEQTILSVLNQTYPHIEYIVMDGGSTDGSAAIIEKYADRVAWWVSEKDNGQSDAINKGLAGCKGQLFAYLNSDDLLAPDAVQKVVDAWLQNPNTALFHGKCSTIDSAGKELRKPEGAPLTFEWLLHNGMLPRVYQPACFFNLGLVTRTPLFNASLHFVMDYDLLLWMKQHELKSIFMDECLAHYRWHDDAKSSTGLVKMQQEKFTVQRKYGAGRSLLWWLRLIKFRIRTLL